MTADGDHVAGPVVAVRPASLDDVDRIVDTMTTAFFNDPLWGPAFPDVELRAGQASAFWRLLVTSSLRYPHTLVTENVESAAVWIPPGGTELSEAELDRFEDFLVSLCGRSVADGILTIAAQFEAARPSEPHFYLSLLGTHADHRGSGWGMRLLRENLARVDALGVPVYLESCNPANDERYHSVGFIDRDQIISASGQVTTTMWRPGR